MRFALAWIACTFVSAAAAQPPERLTVPVPLPPPGATVIEPVTVFKVDTFARLFLPVPGPQRVMFVHPYSGKPTEISFDLPPGKPRVRASRRELRFDYGKHEVKVRFYRDGGYRVDYDR